MLVKSFFQELDKISGNIKVRPVVSISDRDLPIIVYSVMGGQRDLFYSGSYGVARTDFTVNIYSKSFNQLQEVKKSVVDYFHGLSGEIGENDKTLISKAEVNTVIDSFDDRLENVYRSIITINVIS